MQKIIVGNWKMYGDPGMAKAWVQAVTPYAVAAAAEVVVCPPAILIAPMKEWLKGSKILLGGQDCSPSPMALTPAISARRC